MTKVEAIRRIMQDNGGLANWNILYNEIEKYYSQAKFSSEWKAVLRGVLYREIQNNRNFKKLGDSLFGLMDYPDENLLLEGEANYKTTKESIVKMRVNQGLLRKRALKSMRYCPLTGIEDHRLLIVSHIKPWAFSSDKERLDLNNVLVLSPLFDRLFDGGLISFDSGKRLLVSDSLPVKDRGIIGLSPSQIIDQLQISNEREFFMEYHRNKIFLH